MCLFVSACELEETSGICDHEFGNTLCETTHECYRIYGWKKPGELARWCSAECERTCTTEDESVCETKEFYAQGTKYYFIECVDDRYLPSKE